MTTIHNYPELPIYAEPAVIDIMNAMTSRMSKLTFATDADRTHAMELYLQGRIDGDGHSPLQTNARAARYLLDNLSTLQ